MAFIETIAQGRTSGEIATASQRQQTILGNPPIPAQALYRRRSITILISTSLLPGIRCHVDPEQTEHATLAVAHASRSFCC